MTETGRGCENGLAIFPISTLEGRGVFRPVRPRRVSQEIVRQIQDLMGLGMLPPGSKLPPEREMAQQLGVSRPTLREAIGILEHMGLLKSVQGDGTYVLNAAEHCLVDPLQALITGSEERMVELAEFRTEVESWAASLAAQRAEPSDLNLMEEILDEMEKEIARGNPVHQLDAEFHMILARAAHNAVYYHVANTIFNLLAQVTKVSHEKIFRGPKEQMALLDEHKRIYEAVSQKDSQKARELMREHLLRTETWFRKGLRGGSGMEERDEKGRTLQ